MSIEFNPPAWAPYAMPSPQGWRHPVTKELLVAIPGGVKTKPQEVVTEELDKDFVESVINESPTEAVIISEVATETVILDETQSVAEVINETPAEAPVEIINESPVVEVVVTEVPTPETNAAEPVKTPAKRGRKPKA